MMKKRSKLKDIIGDILRYGKSFWYGGVNIPENGQKDRKVKCDECGNHFDSKTGGGILVAIGSGCTITEDRAVIGCK